VSAWEYVNDEEWTAEELVAVEALADMGRQSRSGSVTVTGRDVAEQIVAVRSWFTVAGREFGLVYRFPEDDLIVGHRPYLAEVGS